MEPGKVAFLGRFIDILAELPPGSPDVVVGDLGEGEDFLELGVGLGGRGGGDVGGFEGFVDAEGGDLGLEESHDFDVLLLEHVLFVVEIPVSPTDLLDVLFRERWL